MEMWRWDRGDLERGSWVMELVSDEMVVGIQSVLQTQVVDNIGTSDGVSRCTGLDGRADGGG